MGRSSSDVLLKQSNCDLLVSEDYFKPFTNLESEDAGHYFG